VKLLVVIVNYGCCDLAIACLRSLEPEILSFAGNARVVVTDNQSPDDSVARLTAAIAANHWADWAALQPLPRNGGFAYGNNAAIGPALASAQKPQYVLLLNPDTLVQPGAIATLLAFLDNHPDAGIAGSRLEDPDGTPQNSAFRFHSVSSEFEHGIRLGIVSRLLSSKTVAMPAAEAPHRCDAVAGASMLIRTAVFERIGLMDEKYFMYFEEIDFCLTAARAGFSCWYVPASRVVHLVGAVSQLSDARKHRSRRPAYWFDARRRFFVKNYGRLYAAAADVAFLVGFALWRLRRLLQRKADPDPPRLLHDSLMNSVFFRGWAV
jgi:N-acetylglucosaminyl-diphospho-decaprenol L-rhamnosyltransferase